ncbi:MAG: M48 family metallopeptidase [Kiritimatiellae bacterium]|nr:M48 family metallopeptidase [Kiritimatiellia bacterium]MDD4737261.1 M48 family metallopeptidase [Kiritimatiellia bacterium]
MSVNGYLIFVVAVLIAEYLIELLVDRLNLGHLSEMLPDEFAGVYEPEKYAQSQRYLKTNTRFELLRSSVMLALTLGFIFAGGFGWLNRVALATGWSMIPAGLLFTGMLVLLAQAVSLPFECWSTFVIEERFGFNKTTAKTFILDRIKGLALGVAIGGPILALVLWFFSRLGVVAWLYCWGALTLIQLVLMIVAPVFLLPLFNKFTPLEDGELKESIEAYARENRFTVRGLFKMDGSRRSTKSNAYFTGIGRWRRIALYDTLIERHTVKELVCVLAHEVGHYKLGHIWKQFAVGVLTSGAMLCILSLFLTQSSLYEAFGVAYVPVHGGTAYPIYAGMVFFSFLFSPINFFLSILGNYWSRRHEYQADDFSRRTTQQPEAMISALKKLSVENLSNLTPHPLKVFFSYSHPPVLARIRALRFE